MVAKKKQILEDDILSKIACRPMEAPETSHTSEINATTEDIEALKKEIEALKLKQEKLDKRFTVLMKATTFKKLKSLTKKKKQSMNTLINEAIYKLLEEEQ